MKGFLIFAALLLPAMASAQVIAPRQVMDVAQTFRSTMTCSGVQVSSAVAGGSQATSVVSSTQTLWLSISIQNQDATANVYCSDSVSVSTPLAAGTANPSLGWGLAGAATPTGGSGSFMLAPGELFYCVNDSGSRTSAIAVCKGR